MTDKELRRNLLTLELGKREAIERGMTRRAAELAAAQLILAALLIGGEESLSA